MWLFIVLACSGLSRSPCDEKHALTVIRKELTGPMCHDRVSQARGFMTKPKATRYVYWCEREAVKA